MTKFISEQRMGMSFICYSLQLVIFFFLAGQSFGLHREGDDQLRLNAYLYPAARKMTDTQQSLKQKILDVFFAQLLRQEILADAEQDDLSTMLDQDLAEEEMDRDLAEEETDQLTSITRYVGVGYNLLKASPDGNFELGGTDPGILTTQVIFEFTYQAGKEAYFMDTIVQVPDQVNFQPVASCSRQEKASVYSGEKSYQKSLNYGIDAKASFSGFQFGLSSAIKKANEETAGRKRVFQDQKQICNYGRVGYLTDARGIHTVSKSFYNRVNSLPVKYNMKDYMQFIRDWGTHIIVRADMGAKNITRSSYTYTGVYQQLKNQKSGGFSFGGNFNGQGGSLGLDASKIDISGNNQSKFSSQISAFKIGTKKNPFPIFLSLRNISKALRPEYWTTLPEGGGRATYKSLNISQKKANLERALADYADYEGVDELRDPAIRINYKWPNGEYALPAPEGDCPKGWSRGHRTQGTGNNIDISSGITSRLGVKLTAQTITLHYCVKEKIDDDGGIGFEWPEGSYCIARKGSDCPEDAFKKGNITWNDHKSLLTRKSNNNEWGTLPEGVYGKNTEIFFCCRNDNPASKPMMLPLAEPFVLYRFGGKCQAVSGTTVHSDFIKYTDTSRAFSKNSCTGAYPDDDDCKGEHRIHFCYYSRK